MNFKELKELCQSHGFTHTVPLACDTIELKPEVRQMCASDSCHKYNKCWSCPPGCGTLEECEKRVRKYKLGILVQTVGQLEDSMDGALQAIGYALLVLFFVVGVVKTCGSFTRTCCLLERDAVRSVRSVPIRMRPAVFQGKLFPQWKHMECWSCRCVRQIIWIIIMVQEKLPIPVVIY